MKVPVPKIKFRLKRGLFPDMEEIDIRGMKPIKFNNFSDHSFNLVPELIPIRIKPRNIF